MEYHFSARGHECGPLPEGGQFAELAASKLGVNFRVFRTVAEAERWLSE
jgi:hypothetical protein